MPTPHVIHEAWREMALAFVESKAYAWVVAFFVGLVAVAASALQSAGEVLREVFYIDLFWVFLFVAVLASSLVGRAIAFWRYKHFGKEPRIKNLGWLMVSPPTYLFFLNFAMYIANVAARFDDRARLVVMGLATIAVILTEAYQFFLYWFGRRDTLLGFLKSLFRGATFGWHLSQHDLDAAFASLGGRSEAEPPAE